MDLSKLKEIAVEEEEKDTSRTVYSEAEIKAINMLLDMGCNDTVAAKALKRAGSTRGMDALKDKIGKERRSRED